MNELELYDIYEVWHVPFWQTTWWYIVLGLLISSIVVFCIKQLITYGLQRRAHQELWQQAITEIQKLEQHPCETSQEVKNIYFSLTALLKQYIVHRYKGTRVSDTDQEFLVALKTLPLSESTRTNLYDIFSTTGTVKFAGKGASPDQIKHDLAQSILLIHDTIPVKNK